MPSTSGSTTPSRSSGRERYVTQTEFQGDGTVGNCLQAAVATVLNMPLHLVPHFALFQDWHWALDQFLADHGYAKRRLRGQDCVNGIQLGMSPRGFRHAVAFLDGGMWDPHPDRTGLVSVDSIYEIGPVEVPTEG